MHSRIRKQMRERQRREDRRNELMGHAPVVPWGPFCYVMAEPHPAPFNKTRDGADRRAQRKFVRDSQHRVDDLRPQDDGYFAMQPTT